MAKKKLKMPEGTWREISAAITALTEDEALELLRQEAAADKPRPYVMKRLYHRWRATSAGSDMSALALGKLPGYLRRESA